MWKLPVTGKALFRCLLACYVMLSVVLRTAKSWSPSRRRGVTACQTVGPALSAKWRSHLTTTAQYRIPQALPPYRKDSGPAMQSMLAEICQSILCA